MSQWIISVNRNGSSKRKYFQWSPNREGYRIRMTSNKQYAKKYTNMLDALSVVDDLRKHYNLVFTICEL